MKKIIIYKVVLCNALILLFLPSCQKESWLEKQQNDINYSLNNTILFPIATPESKVLLDTANNVSSSYQGSTYQCNTQKIKFSKPIETIQLSGLDASHRQVYPGAILQLKDLYNQGKFMPVEQFPRGTLSLKSSFTGALPQKIELFNDAKARFAIENIKNSIRNKEGITTSYVAREAYQAKQGFLELGIHPNWVNSSLIPLPYSNQEGDIGDKTVLLQFTQTHYSVELDAPPTNSAEFFSPNLKMEEFKKVATFENPLGYVNKVSYGIKILISMSSLDRNAPSHAVLVKKLNEITQNGIVKIDEQSKEMFKSCLFSIIDVVTDGNTRINRFNMLGTEFLTALQNQLSNLSLSSAPIEYQVRYLSNHTPFVSQANIEYTDHQCRLLPTAVYISRIAFQYFAPPPPTIPGVVTPIYRNPDVGYVVWDSELKELERSQLTYGVLLSRGTFWYTSIKVSDLTKPIYVGIGSTAGGLGSIGFTLKDHIPKDGFSYPDKITKSIGNDAVRLNITLGLSWY